VETGRILQFDEARGYGFIARDGGGEDVFVHARDLEGFAQPIQIGTRIRFEMIEGDRGPKAFAVQPADLSSAGAFPRPSAPAGRVPGSSSRDDDTMCDVLTANEFGQEVAAVLIEEAPELRGAQIVRVRQRLLGIAEQHGWIEG
jgi:CspA family cold shock protein